MWDILFKQNSKVKHSGCMLDETMPGEEMAFLLLTVLINWSSSIGKTKFWLQKLRRLLCNTLIQLHFYYACSAWYFNLTKKLKSGTQTAQNKFISFYLQLDNMILMWYFTRFDTMYTIWKTWKTHMEECYFQSATTLKWLPLTNRFNQSINSTLFYILWWSLP